jgi:MerR family transcriptional regulator, heat shock protein HspR
VSNYQQRGPGPAPDQGVYGISVAAELCSAPIQSIRLWERHGLLTPARTQGGTRRYSAEDLTLIAGITRILDLEDANTALRTAGSSRR